MVKRWSRWQDWTNAVLGIWLFFAPWVLGTTADGASTWNAWIVGVAIVCMALWALATPESKAAEWTNVVLGIWLVIAPWALEFVELSAAAWNAWIVGAAVVTLALLVLFSPARTRQQHQ